MKRALLLFVFGLCTAAGVSGQVVLDANFDGKTVDQPIGTGGAALGEPTDVSTGITAIVRSAPLGSNSLEITDASSFSAGAVAFDFLELAEVTGGVVRITCVLWFDQLDQFELGVRESQGFTQRFVTLSFVDNGLVLYRDGDSTAYVPVGNYITGQALSLLLEYDLDAGTYDVELDGTPLLDDEVYGVAARGIGRVFIGTGADADLVGTVYVDDLRVEVNPIFADDFESGSTSSWSGHSP